MQLRSRKLLHQTTRAAVARQLSTDKPPALKRKIKTEPTKSRVTAARIKVEPPPPVGTITKGVQAEPTDFVAVKVEGAIKEEKVLGGETSMNDDDASKALDVKRRPAPEKWEEIWDGIETMRADKTAPVDSEGCETFNDASLEPAVRRFHVLVACMLSSQTKDQVNAAAMGRLRAHGLTVDAMLAIDEKELAALIRPVGFFNNKAKYIRETCAILKAQYGSDIPDTYDALVALPGVGPKMAHLTMSAAWQNTVGICVDIHVHRISNRLGWAKTWSKGGKSQDPEKTRKELEDWLPFDRWNAINVLLVGFGQQTCVPLKPKCTDCAVNHLCPSAFKKASP
ncbi:Aste57867_21096 [Aphanomyces stellatus]|uniref:Endonuclease III homolog n=1 Tax=Aphanomyces stellatus TaxID=120398 RepID=A0A485LLB6_9STRA|nr:hypothetical protein As57867_021028 [Aphanomyces stellatus]VFT97770.1 Aste57867_21096 [Aphanomyces stellatus]